MENAVLVKQCTRCDKIKEYKEFSKHKKHKDGLQYECKYCQRNLTRLYRRHKRQQAQS